MASDIPLPQLSGVDENQTTVGAITDGQTYLIPGDLIDMSDGHGSQLLKFSGGVTLKPDIANPSLFNEVVPTPAGTTPCATVTVSGKRVYPLMITFP